MRVLVLWFALLLAVPAAAQALQPGTIGTARSIVARMQIDRMMDQTFDQLMPLLTSNVVNAMRQDASVSSVLKERLATEKGVNK